LTALAVTGNITSGNVSGTTGAFTNVSGSGAALSALNGSNVSTGTVAAARIAALDASKITTGTLAVLRGGTGVTTSTGTGAVVLGTSPTFTTQITVPAIVKSGTTGVGNIGAAGSAFNTVFAKATSAQYADLAENYAADAEYEPGTVLIFGGTAEVTVANAAGDTRIAGVVSTDPAHLMNSVIDCEHPAAVALTGRVPTKVTGTVRKGDMMVAAGNGRAQACSTPALGSVIGKALADFDGTSGVIEVVVGRL
jgi:hypothetical protein